MHPLINIAVKAARNSSKIILQAYDRLSSVKVDEKSRNDYVTDVDQKSEQEIIATIRKAYPEHSFLAEEGGEITGNPDFQWIIDPLDGTANFIHGFPQFAISIAFKHKENIEQAVIFDPLRNELFTASRGEGAQLNERRIRVSPTDRINRALIGTGFPFRHPKIFPRYLQYFAKIAPQVSDLRRAGAAALDLAYVAAGRLDGHFELALKPWDIAAGVLLVKEAGGFVSDFAGQSDYLKSGDIIAGNPKIFDALQTIIHPKAA